MHMCRMNLVYILYSAWVWSEIAWQEEHGENETNNHGDELHTCMFWEECFSILANECEIRSWEYANGTVLITNS